MLQTRFQWACKEGDEESRGCVELNTNTGTRVGIDATTLVAGAGFVCIK